MVREFVNPNWHVALVHMPIGLLVVGALIEAFSFLGWRRGGFRSAGRWMILLGVLSGMPVALSGAYALQDVARLNREPMLANQPWSVVLEQSPLVQDAAAWRHMTRHAWIQSAAALGLLVIVFVWLACTDSMRRKLHVPLVLLMLGGTGATLWGAWEAGEGVYAHAVGQVSDHDHHNHDDADAHEPATAPAAPGAAGEPQQRPARTIEFYIPPMQLHVLLAGVCVSFAVVALALGIRGAVSHSPPVDGMDDLAAALNPSIADDPDEAFLSPEHRAKRRADSPLGRDHTLPSARFWLLATLSAILAAVVGVWVLDSEAETGWDFKTLSQYVFDPDQDGQPNLNANNRRAAHVIAGTSIVVVTILLALFGRFAPRRLSIMLILGFILLLALAAQVWLGILLLFDTNSGSIMGFN